MSTTVLLRSAKEDGGPDPYEQVLKNNGVKAISIPVLDFVYVNLEEFVGHLDSRESYSGLVLTSQRSVEAIARAAKDKMADITESWNKVPVFVVGRATKGIAEAKLGLKCQGEDAGRAETLAEAIVSALNKDKEEGGGEGEEKPAKPLLFPCSNIKMETLPRLLEEAGVPVTCVTVYQTAEHQAIRENLEKVKNDTGTPTYMVFFSPSGVMSTCDILKDLSFNSTKFVAVGPSTATVLQEKGLPVAAVAKRPTPEGVAEACKEAETWVPPPPTLEEPKSEEPEESSEEPPPPDTAE